MISLENVSIDTLGLGNRRIQWEVVPTHEDLNIYVLDLYRAEAPGDLSEFDVVISGIASSDGTYIDSGLERMDYSTNRKIYYYINPRNTATLETAESGPYVMESEPDYAANDIIRTYTNFFENPRYQTRTFQVLKKRTWGNYCSCIDPISQEVRNENCQLCYGTGFDGGYFNPIAIRGMRSDKPSRQMINLFGVWHDTDVFFKLQNTLEVVPGDRIVDEHGEIYLIEGPVNHLQKGIYTIMQNVRAKTLSKADPVYTYDLTEELGGDPPAAEGGQQYGVFNGTSSYLEIDDNDLLSFVTGANDDPFSISFWINTPGGSSQVIVNKGLEYQVRLGIPGRPSFTLFDNNNLDIISIEGDGVVANNTWTFVAMTYSGNNKVTGMNMYLDAVLLGDFDSELGSEYTSMVAQTTPLRIGRGNPPEQSLYTEGQIRLFKIFSEELSPADIRQEYELGSYTINMVAHYKLYTDTNDYGRNELHGNNTDVTFSQE